MDLSNVTITTSRLLLVSVSERYAKNIFDELTPEVTKYMFPAPAKTLDDTLQFITTSTTALKSGQSLNVTVLKKDTQEFLGGAGLNHVKSGAPELGIWIKRSAHGNRYGQEAILGLKQWADLHLQYDHLIYPVDKYNIASCKIAASLGGVIKKEYKKTNQSGRELDVVEYWIYPRT